MGPNLTLHFFNLMFSVSKSSVVFVNVGAPRDWQLLFMSYDVVIVSDMIAVSEKWLCVERSRLLYTIHNLIIRVQIFLGVLFT